MANEDELKNSEAGPKPDDSVENSFPEPSTEDDVEESEQTVESDSLPVLEEPEPNGRVAIV